MRAEIRAASTAAERDALYAFRYRIYVEEMRRVQRYADHERRRIEDPLDTSAHNLVAWEGDTVVGCLRVNFCEDGGTEYYRDLLAMDRLVPNYPKGVSLCTRLMVARENRGSPLGLRLCAAADQVGLSRAVQWNFIDCNDHLVPFFQRLGYVWTHLAVHDEYGSVNAMRLELSNWHHLQACRSPFLRYRRRATGARVQTKPPAGHAVYMEG